MTDKQTGGPAFGAHPESANWHPSWQGMTLRDYFAAKALQSLILIYEPEGEKSCVPDCAADAYTYADAMLKAREA